MRETSLEDFLDGSDGDASSTSEADPSTASEDDDRVPADGDDDSRADASVTAEAVDPATVTYAWTPDGSDCADCDESVERRWLDSDRLVCADCKQW